MEALAIGILIGTLSIAQPLPVPRPPTPWEATGTVQVTTAAPYSVPDRFLTLLTVADTNLTTVNKVVVLVYPNGVNSGVNFYGRARAVFNRSSLALETESGEKVLFVQTRTQPPRGMEDYRLIEVWAIRDYKEAENVRNRPERTHENILEMLMATR
jgi:hypothetical protein